MAEATHIMFELTEVVEVLIKKQGLHEGLWGLSVEFGLGAANIPTGPDGKTLMPAAINTVQHIGIKKYDEPTNLTVDAAEVNPAPKGVKKAAAKKAAAKKGKG
jgi:hypothetical protein